jgi:AraC-like DNA-binding protein
MIERWGAHPRPIRMNASPLTDRSGRITFNTHALPERDRFPAFCEEFFRAIVGADVVRLGDMPFRGSLDVRRAGMVGISDIATTAVDFIRNAKYLRDGNDDIVVQLWRHGLAGATQGLHDLTIKANDGLVIDNARIARIRPEKACRFWSLAIPRSRIEGIRTNENLGTGLKLNVSEPLRLLLDYLEGTVAQHLKGGATAELFGSHLVDLVVLALGRTDDTSRFDERPGVREARLASILQAIAEQSANQALNAATIAGQLGITPRYVHLLLEKSGRSFTQHLLQIRLAKAAALLAKDASPGKKIVNIAAEAGFADISHFNRAFRRHFGDTPSGVRASALRNQGDG